MSPHELTGFDRWYLAHEDTIEIVLVLSLIPVGSAIVQFVLNPWLMNLLTFLGVIWPCR